MDIELGRQHTRYNDTIDPFDKSRPTQVNGPVTGASAASVIIADPPDGSRVLRLEGGECANCEGSYDGIYVRSDLITVQVPIEI